MPIGQAIIDQLSGLGKASRGDYSGLQAYTKQGRADLAQQREGQRLDQEVLNNALRKAAVDPEANYRLQQFLAHGLANKATVAGTEHVKEQTAGLKTQNVAAERQNAFFQKYGGSPQTAEFGQRQQLQDVQVPGIEAQTAQTKQATGASIVEQARKAATEKMWTDMGFPSAEAGQQLLTHGYKTTELAQQARAHTQATGAQIFGHLQPDIKTGQPGEAQRAVAEQSGFTIPPDAEAAQRKAIADAEMQRVAQSRQPKVQPAQQPHQGLGGPMRQPTPPRAQPTQTFQGLGGPMLEPGIMQSTAEAMLRKMGFDVSQPNNLQRALDIIRALTGGSVDVQTQGGQ